MRVRAAVVVAVVASVALGAPRAHANGRFPAAQDVQIGAGADDATIVLRATFGLVVSRDHGATFDWVCENALELDGLWDPPLVVAADGAVLAGLPDGLLRSDDACRWSRDPSVGVTQVEDLATDGAGDVVVAVESNAAAPNRVLASHDRGRSFVALGAGVSDARFATVEAARSRPARVYATATGSLDGAPRLYRSDDGGATLALAPARFADATAVFLSAIDPLREDTLWLRAARPDGTQLLRSDDGGATTRTAFVARGALLGFALSDDGARVWTGGPDDGLWRSDDGGRTFARVADVPVTCLRYHAGALYACADWTRADAALFAWRDGDAAPHALLRFDQIRGPLACAAGTTQHDVCAPRWSVQQATWAREGGVADARDAGVTVPVPRGCAIRARAARGAHATALIALALALARGRRTRPRATGRRTS